ncbi:MAG: class I SAM-dependent RNA methyltransferase [Oscillospiraceae bacterium]|nr:class I SAM-dependent RNA methyltransferase [Oscillospiraceae bacterium]
MSVIKMAAPCLFGLESVLSGELKRMGAKNIEASDGKVTFTGDWSMLAKANIWLRTAERVLIVLDSFRAETFEELFQGVVKIPFEDYVGKDDAFPVKGWSLNSQLASVPDCQSIIKRAAVKRMEQHYHQSWFTETGVMHQIQFSIRKNIATIFLDTSGAGLHKRGYRQTSVLAPIKETLAAGIVDFTRLYDDSVIYDPFCGSGTLLIEAVLKGMNIAPGINRRFAAESWGCIPAEAWKDARYEAMESIQRDAKIRAYGYDIDPQAVELTMANAKKAGVAAHIRTKVQDISQFTTSSERSIVVCNPPYGERLLEIKGAEKLYREMGEVFTPDPDKKYYIISPHEEFEHIFGRTADRRRKLYNGMIKCQLFMYFR